MTADTLPLLPSSPAAWKWEYNRFLPASSLPLWDRGFRYGMALFETIAVRQGRPLFFQEHLESLRISCAARGVMAPEAHLPVCALSNATQRQPGIDGLLRIYVTCGEGAPMAPISGTRFFLLWEPQPLQLKPSYQVLLASQAHQPLFGGLKTANYWANIDALSQAQTQGSDEALLFSPQGLLISACMANAFLVIDGQLHTPELNCGARNGILRQWVLSRRAVRQRTLRLEDVEMAEDIFLTNSRIGIMPVSRVAERLMPNSLISSALKDEYEDAIAT